MKISKQDVIMLARVFLSCFIPNSPGIIALGFFPSFRLKSWEGHHQAWCLRLNLNQHVKLPQPRHTARMDGKSLKCMHYNFFSVYFCCFFLLQTLFCPKPQQLSLPKQHVPWKEYVNPPGFHSWHCSNSFFLFKFTSTYNKTFDRRVLSEGESSESSQ